MKEVALNANGFRKIKNRLVWIYNKEIERLPNGIEKGQICKLTYKGNPVALAFVNPLSKITARILSFANEDINGDFIRLRIESAIKRRSHIKNTNSLRLFHSDADGLSGLVVDRYADNLVVSFDSAGVDRLKDKIIETLVELIKPKGIYKKDNPIREKEGLAIESQTVYGQIDDEFIVEENGRRFITNLKQSQKSGFFLDQRDNRLKVSQYKADRVLDLFAHSGGFGIYLNPEFVKFVEISADACQRIKTNCSLNGVKNYQIINGDVFDFLKNETETYDMIIIDPPAFAKNRHAVKGAFKGLKYLITNSLNLVKENGHIAVFSCSNSIGFKELLNLSLSSSIASGCKLEVVEFLKQAKDHPYILNIPSSLYLTGLLLKKT
ncbi:class I SAM-dependent rRNA methyltransferase [Hippea sp. KM1]|uniref:class I SAM-dependent rRNA methyltransferase n=1 Tax=Hippea sp. KM1 TaxID=944481 RepID=UPI00046CA8DD|nr:class I SAM-dependent rRNA methyltransferase [Hippea sp. KM1]